jgi:hypothetical protein
MVCGRSFYFHSRLPTTKPYCIPLIGLTGSDPRKGPGRNLTAEAPLSLGGTESLDFCNNAYFRITSFHARESASYCASSSR